MKLKTKIIGGLFGLASLLMASQANAATVRINPASITVANSSTFELLVEGFEFPDTNGGGFVLGWDTTILQLVSTEAVMVADMRTKGWDTPSAAIDIVGTQGTVSALAFTFGAPKTGTFDVLTLTFQSLQTGLTNAALSLNPNNGDGTTDGSEWFNPDLFTTFPVTYEGASITVGAVPVPSAAWLFGSGLIGMVGIARRRKTQLA